MKKFPNVIITTHNPVDYVDLPLPSLKESRRNLKVVKASITLNGSLKYIHGEDSLEWIRNESNSRTHYRGDFSSVDEVASMIYGQTNNGDPTPPMPLDAPMNFNAIPQEENTMMACFQYNYATTIRPEEKLTLRRTYILQPQQSISIACDANTYVYNIDSSMVIDGIQFETGSWCLVEEQKTINVTADSNLVLAVFD